MALVPKVTLFRLTVVILGIFFVSLILLIMRAPAPVGKLDINYQYQTIISTRRRSLSTFLAVLILSSPENRDRRDAIRNTWLKYAKSVDSLTYFIVCTRNSSYVSALEKEAVDNSDLILFPDVEDSYQSLTSKVLLSFQWLYHNVNFSFVLKVDDDSFARVDILSDELHQRSNQSRPLYWGFFDGRARIKKKGRWAELNWTLCDRYLPHARGGGYVLSSSLVEHVVRSKEVLQRFSSEDISVGAWMAPLDIDRIHDPRFDTEHVSRGCSDAYVVTHKQDVTAMLAKYNNILVTGRLCGTDGQFKTRNSYVYNWFVLPSLCCIRNDSSVP